MLICSRCGKKTHRISFSRHQKGSSGASQWPLRAQITKHTQKPNLHLFKGKKYCTKCLRIVKLPLIQSFKKQKQPQAQV